MVWCGLVWIGKMCRKKRMQKVVEVPEAEYTKQSKQIFRNYSAETFLINMHYFICQET
jgi:hypothetical protein